MRSGHLDEDRAAVLRMGYEARDFALERGVHFMIWGLALALLHGAECLPLRGLSLDLPFGFSPFVRETVFVGLLLLAALGSYIFERYHAVSPVNVLSRTLLLLWGTIAAGLLIMDFLGGVTGLVAAGPRVGAMAALLGTGFVVSASLVLQWRLLWFGGFWWGAAVLFYFLDAAAADFLAMAAFLGGLFVPGLSFWGLYRHGQRNRLVPERKSR